MACCTARNDRIRPKRAAEIGDLAQKYLSLDTSAGLVVRSSNLRWKCPSGTKASGSAFQLLAAWVGVVLLKKGDAVAFDGDKGYI